MNCYKSFILFAEFFLLFLNLFKDSLPFFFFLGRLFRKILKEGIFGFFFIFNLNLLLVRSNWSIICLFFLFTFLILCILLAFFIRVIIFFNMLEPFEATHCSFVVHYGFLIISLMKFLVSLFTKLIIHKKALSYFELSHFLHIFVIHKQSVLQIYRICVKYLSFLS